MMKARGKRATGLAMAMMMASAMMPTMQVHAEDAEWYKAIDTSDEVNLVFYVCGNAPEDKDVVEDAVNEILKEKINTTIEFQFSTWTDWSQKYALALTGGTADLIYTANFVNYQTYATSGAFLELDDLMETYAPDILEAVAPEALEQCKVMDSLYCIPNTWKEYSSLGILYREDLRKKYDLPKPDSLENIEAYLLGIKENDPSQGLLGIGTGESTGLNRGFDIMSVFNMKYNWVKGDGLMYGLGATYDNPSEIIDYWNSPDYLEDLKLVKKWADEGLWSRSVLSDPSDSEDFNNGTVVMKVAGMNPNKCITAVNKFEKDGKGWEAAYITYGELTGSLYPNAPTSNATSITRSCKNPERALMVLDLLLTDPELNELIQCGIEGVHYELDEDGVYTNLSEAYGYEGMNTWNLRNGDLKLPQKSDVLLQEMFDRYEEIGNKTKTPNINISSGFSEDYTSYATERSAVRQVMDEYLAPLEAGLVDDPEEALAVFLEKVEKAGLSTCREAYISQWEAYCEKYGY